MAKHLTQRVHLLPMFDCLLHPTIYKSRPGTEATVHHTQFDQHKAEPLVMAQTTCVPSFLISYAPVYNRIHICL